MRNLVVTKIKWDAFHNLVSFLYNLKSTKNTHGKVLVNLQIKAFNVTKSNTHPWVFSTFFKLYKWYQVAQSIKNVCYRVCQIGLSALVRTATLSTIHTSFTFMYMHISKLCPFLKRVTNLCTALLRAFVCLALDTFCFTLRSMVSSAWNKTFTCVGHLIVTTPIQAVKLPTMTVTKLPFPFDKNE